LLLAAALALLGCKEKASAPPATTPPATGPAEAGPGAPPATPPSPSAPLDDAGAPSDAAVDAGDVMASPQCCCAMPTPEPTFELHPRDHCQGDLKGTCVIARNCRKQKTR
jgi:hypothetical protein